MQVFLVGGAVRDELLGEHIDERDWVVVGATPEELIAQNFQPVGKDFPVFLHPETHEEYALARTERKTSKGYKGFKFYAAPDVSLKEDLRRRDLTINAIAKAPDGSLIDPYNGQNDIHDRWLRHVSPAFAEDPVRILRIGRFASRFPEFNVHPSTVTLMKEMVESGEVDALVPERVWKEFSRTLESNLPNRFFDVLNTCGAMAVLFPELLHNQQCIETFKKTIAQNKNGIIRFAALLYPLSEKEIKSFCKRYRVPNDFLELAVLASKNAAACNDLNIKDEKAILVLLKATDAFRRPERLKQFLTLCDVFFDNKMHKTMLLKALDAANAVDTKSLQTQNLKGKAFGDAVYQLQLDAIAQVIEK